MKSALRIACLTTSAALLPLALAACQGEKKTAQQGTAEGEILPGSASDAMLPYDTVRSQPPLAPMPTGSAKGGGKSGSGSDEAADEAGGDEPAADEGPGDPPTAEAPEPAKQ